VERQEKFWEMLSNFDVTTVKAEVQKLIDRTREGSAERAAIQLALDKMRYVESLLRIMESRAASLPASQADWHLFDMSVEEGFLVVAANERGVQLNDPEYGNEKELRWAAISSGARVAFLEALRNPKSATETLWLGAYCKLLGEGAAEQYFSYALMLDSSPEMKAQIKALRKD